MHLGIDPAPRVQLFLTHRVTIINNTLAACEAEAVCFAFKGQVVCLSTRRRLCLVELQLAPIRGGKVFVLLNCSGYWPEMSNEAISYTRLQING